MWTPATWWKRRRMIRAFWRDFDAGNYTRARCWGYMLDDLELVALCDRAIAIREYQRKWGFPGA